MLSPDVTELTGHHTFKLAVHANICCHVQTHTISHSAAVQHFGPSLSPLHGFWPGLHCPESHSAAVGHDSVCPHTYCPPFYLA